MYPEEAVGRCPGIQKSSSSHAIHFHEYNRVAHFLSFLGRS